MLSFLANGYWTSLVWFELNRTPSMLLYAGLSVSTVIAVRREQNANALSPMLVTLAGIVTLLRL